MVGQAGVARPPRELVKFALIALGLIFCFQIAVFAAAAQTQARFGRLLDLTSSQRMLTQRLALLAVGPAGGATGRVIEQAATELVRAPSLGSDLDQRRTQFAAQVRAAARGDATAAATVAASHDALVIAIDDVTRQEADARRMAAALLTGTLTATAILAIAIIAALWGFVIAPAFARADDATRQIERARRRLDSLVDYSPMPILEFDRDGHVRRANGAAAALFGRTSAELEALPLATLFALAQRPVVDAKFAAALTATAGHCYVEALVADGAGVNAILHVSPVVVDGRVEGVFAVLQSVAEIMESERRREASEERFRSLFEHHPQGIIAISKSGDIVNINAAMLHINGYRRDEVVGRPAAMLVPPERREQTRTAMERTLGGDPVEIDSIALRKDGERVPVAVTTVPIIAGGSGAGVFAVVRDVREQLRLEREHEDQRRLFAALFENHPDVVVAIDAHGRIMLVNAATAAATGFESAQVMARHFFTLLRPADRASLRDAVRAVRSGVSAGFEARLRTAPGIEIPIAARLVPIIRGGAFAGAYAIARDVSAERRAHALEVVQTERLRALYNVAAAAGRAPLAQVEDALRYGARELGMQYGFVAHVDRETVTSVCATESGGFPPGTQRQLATSLSGAIGQAGYLACESLSNSRWSHLRRQGPDLWEALIATEVEVGGRPFGTFGFTDPRARAKPFTEADREFVALMGALVSSALERLEHQTQLDRLAHFDVLTGLPNRALLFDRIERAVAAAKRDGGMLALHYFDLDRFKNINDAFGHAEGDLVLIETGRRLAGILRETDTVARLGGDEFVILQTSLDSAADAERLRQRIDVAFVAPFVGTVAQHQIGASSGFALFPDDATTLESLLLQADARLYAEKRAKRVALAPQLSR